jgi:hypothetical protein
MTEQDDPAVTEVAFALTPAFAIAGVIDYSTKQGIQLYKDATAKLTCNQFDCQSVNLKVFLQTLKDRAIAYGWNDILDVPREIGNINSSLVNLIDNFGELELDHIKAHVTTYIASPCRAAQDEAQLYACLNASLTQTAIAKISTWKKDYTVAGKTSGTLMLKVILRETHIDTRGTILHIRGQLSKLDTYIPTINHDISKFNEHVMDLLRNLEARGAHTEDLLANLFKAYMAVMDEQFVEYIRKKKDAYDEGEDISPETLMHHAARKYANMKRDNTWKAPSASEEKILALQASIAQLKRHKPKQKPKQRPNNKNKREKPSWMLKKPDDITKVKWVNGKDYHWCPKHQAFGRHLPTACEGKGVQPSTSANNNKKPPLRPDGKTPGIRLSQALTTIVEDEE